MKAEKIWDIMQAGAMMAYFKEEGLKQLKECLTEKEYKNFYDLLKEGGKKE